MRDLSNKVAMVTGANRGIGAATAIKLAEYGATVLLTGRDRASLNDVANIIYAAGGTVGMAICDVSKYDDVQNAVNRCVNDYGSIDILVNNAGTIDPIVKLSESDPEVWGKAIDVNVKGVYHGLRAALPAMAKQGTGSIVNLSSGAASTPLEGWSHYCASKAAAKMLTVAAHKEAFEQGVRVMGLSPGTVATDMMAKIKASGVNQVSQLDWSTHITPEWVAEGIAYLCTPAGDHYVGKDLELRSEEARRLIGLIT